MKIFLLIFLLPIIVNAINDDNVKNEIISTINNIKSDWLRYELNLLLKKWDLHINEINIINQQYTSKNVNAEWYSIGKGVIGLPGPGGWGIAIIGGIFKLLECVIEQTTPPLGYGYFCQQRNDCQDQLPGGQERRFENVTQLLLWETKDDYCFAVGVPRIFCLSDNPQLFLDGIYLDGINISPITDFTCELDERSIIDRVYNNIKKSLGYSHNFYCGKTGEQMFEHLTPPSIDTKPDL